MKFFYLLFLIIGFLFSSCWHSGYYSHEDLSQGGDFRDSDVESEVIGLLRSEWRSWWEIFGDENLNSAMDEVLGNNLGVRASIYRIKQAEALARARGAGYWPELRLSRGVGYDGNVGKSSGGKMTYNLMFDASYTVDLWGETGARDRLLEHAVLNARDEAIISGQVLSGRFVKLWLQLGALRHIQEVYSDLKTVFDEVSEVLKSSYRSGSVEGLDLLQYESVLSNFSLKVRSAELEALAVIEEMRVLSGGHLDDAFFSAVNGLPELPDGSFIAGSVSRVEDRVSVRVARRRVESADARIVIALSERLPGLRLSANFGFRSAKVGSLFSQLIYGVAASFVWSIFEGFKRVAAFEGAKYGYEAESLLYAEALLTAVLDATAGVYRDKQCRESYLRLSEESERLRVIFDLSQRMYGSGSMDGYRLLQSLRDVFNGHVAVIEAQLRCLDAEVELLNRY